MQYSSLKARKWPRRTPAVRWVERKLNGNRIIIERWKEETIFLRTRTEGVDLWPKFQDFEPWASKIRALPPMTMLDTECWAEGVHSTDVNTLINEQDSRLQISPFAVPFIDGFEPSPNHGPAWIKSVVERLGFQHNEGWEVDHEAFDLTHWRELARLKKWEGYVAKVGHLQGWYKIKPLFEPIDFIITGINVSESATYYGGIKSFQCSLYNDDGKLVHIVDCCGLTASIRDAKPHDQFIGRVIEVQHDGRAGDGGLLFPRFERWREDKPANECTMEQLP